MTVLVNSNKVRDRNCDNVVQQYENVLDSVPIIDSHMFSSFNPNVCKSSTGDNLTALFDTVKIFAGIFILSGICKAGVFCQ